MSRVLGLDWGTRRIGVAVSDDRRGLAVGYAVWPANEAEFLPLLKRAIADEDIGLIVVGYPLTLRGEQGKSTQAVNLFIERLQPLGIPITRADERYTSQEASADLTRIGISQKKQRGKLDMAAAVLLLQSFLDQENRTRQHD